MTNLAKGELVMDKQEQRKEVEFRLAKILLKIMQKNDLISNEEMEQAIIKLADEINPPSVVLERSLHCNEN